MKKFMVLYMAPIEAMQEMMKNSTPEDRKKGMDAWTSWLDSHKGDLADGGAALGKNKRVTKDAIKDASNEVGGYSIVQADSHDEAAKIAQSSPNFDVPGAYIEVMEVIEM